MYCVIMGDIIGSRDIDPNVREQVTKAAQRTFDQINTTYISSLMASFGMVRGDSFEGVLLTQYHAPKIIQDIIKSIYRVDKTKVRISIAMGQLSVTSSDRNVTDGPAFHTALDNIEMLKANKSSHWFQVTFDVGTIGKALVESQMGLLSALTEGWTDKQREVVWAMEAYDNQPKLVSKHLGISVSVVQKQLRAASFDVYQQAWKALTEFLVDLDEYTVDEGKEIVGKSYVPYFNLALRKLEQQYNPKEALPLLEKALEIATEELGDNDPLLIPIYNELAREYMFSEAYNDAEKTIQTLMQLQENMPKTREEYAQTLLARAEMYQRKEEFDKAETSFHEALDIVSDAVGKRHYLYGNICNSLAILYSELGDYKNALEYYETSLDRAEDDIDNYPVSYAVTLENIAVEYSLSKDYDRAVDLAEKALELYKENLAPNHEYITSIQTRLSTYKKLQGGDTA